MIIIPGKIVRFIDGLYEDEKDNRYIVIEVNGNRCIIEYICNLPIPPQSLALTKELEVITD
jgi:hypothetical protein